MRVCVLSGGNTKGGYQAGALLKLEEKGIVFDRIQGVSVGAINSIGWAYGSAKELVDIWLSLKKTSDLISFEFFSSFKRIMPTYNLNPLQKRLKKYVEGKNFPKCEAVVSYVDLRNGQLIHASTKEHSTQEMITYTIASASEPPMIKALNGIYLDGGLRDQTPLKSAIDAGADEIFVILTSPFTYKMNLWNPSFPRAWSELTRTVDIILNEAFYNDIERCLVYNKIPTKRKIDLKWISPSECFPGSFKIKPDIIKRAIELGYHDANKFLKK